VGGFWELLVWIGWAFFLYVGEVAVLPHIFGGMAVILYIRIGFITLKKRTFLIGISWRFISAVPNYN